MHIHQTLDFTYKDLDRMQNEGFKPVFWAFKMSLCKAGMQLLKKYLCNSEEKT